MLRLLAALAALALLASGCTVGSSGGGTKGANSTPTVPPAVTGTTDVPPGSASTMPLTVFRVRDGALQAQSTSVPRSRAVAESSLRALGLEAPVSIANGTASVALPEATAEQVAEVVYTLTQFPAITRVDVGGRAGLTRDDVAGYLPQILVERPAADADVGTAIAVTGSASVFEATLVVQLRDGSKVLQSRMVTATAGAPDRGTFATDLNAPGPGSFTVAAFAPSAADGTPQHEQDVPVTVRP